MPDLASVNKDKPPGQQMGFAVPAGHRVKINKRKQKKEWKMK